MLCFRAISLTRRRNIALQIPRHADAPLLVVVPTVCHDMLRWKTEQRRLFNNTIYINVTFSNSKPALIVNSFNHTKLYTSSSRNADDKFHSGNKSSGLNPISERPKSSRKTAHIKRNQKIMELGKGSQWKKLLSLHDMEGHDFSDVNYATILSQLGKCRGLDRNHPSFEALTEELYYKVETNGVEWMGEHGCARVIYSMGKIRPSDEYSYKLMHILVEDSAEWFVQGGTPLGIANAVWAYAKLKFPAPKLFAEVARNAKWIFNNGNSQDISNIVWAYAAVGFRSRDLLAEMDKNSKKVILEGIPQHTANVIWACAKLDYVPHALLSKIDRNAKHLVECGNPQTIANTMWACATLGHPVPALFGEVEHNAHWIVQESHSQNVSNMVWACATIGYDAPKLFAEVEQNSDWIFEYGEVQAISNIVWACAKLAFDAPIMFAEMEGHAKRIIDEGTPQAISNTIWACSTLGYEASNLFAELERDPNERLVRQGNSNQMANSCWALALQNLGANHPRLLQQFWAQAINMNPSTFSQASLNQLALVKAFTLGVVRLDKPSPDLLHRMDHAMAKSQKLQSSFQQKVSSALDIIGFPHQQEISPLNSLRLKKDGFLAIDLACINRMIAIECDGPFHFLKALGTGEMTRIRDGRTKAKRQYLERQGWTVINLHYQDWTDALRYCKENELLQSELAKVGVPALQ